MTSSSPDQSAATPNLVGSTLVGSDLVGSSLVGSGLSGLGQVLSREKTLLARRLVALGERVTEHEFDRRGLRLSQREWDLVQQWLDHGLVTSVVERTRSTDGTVKLLVQLQDGRRVESVAMPVGACCVSTQVGCAVGCRFCASGMFGVERHLTPDEIVEQVVHARAEMRIGRVVYMGMGEPSHNLDNVLTAVARLRDELGMSAKRQTLSTVGGVHAIERMLAADARPCLALSIHTPKEDVRRELLPRAHKDRLEDIVAAADRYSRAVGTPIQFEYTLLEGVNDGDDDVDLLVDLLRGVRGYVNFIKYNAVDGVPFVSPPRARIVEIVQRVNALGILAKIRDSAGSDADAACGQLRLRDKQKQPCD
ncbi:MAG: 23S rRNA (adenine(2503)-C(2))-methyltransferase RlmN [Planctomycetota bacterium]